MLSFFCSVRERWILRTWSLIESMWVRTRLGAKPLANYLHIIVGNEIRDLTLCKTWPTCWPGSKNIRVKLYKIHAFSQVSQIYRVIFLALARSATSARRRTFCSGDSRMESLTGINKRGWLTACKTAGHCCMVRISKPVVVLQSGHIHTWNRVHLSWKKHDNHS